MLMEKKDWDGIRFHDSLAECGAPAMAGRVLHVLCEAGSLSFLFREVRYNVVAGDYVILPEASLASAFSGSSDLRACVMSLSGRFVVSLAIRSDYGVVGHLSLLQNPVMHLSPSDFRTCRADLARLRGRMAGEGHLFREEMLGHLLMAHIFDLYDIHARCCGASSVTARAASLMRRFIALLHSGECRDGRGVARYAERLCVTPHYLSEVCREVSGQPASFWVDRFVAARVARLLRESALPLSVLAARLGFSSLSHFSRYVSRHLGCPPSAFRRR